MSTTVTIPPYSNNPYIDFTTFKVSTDSDYTNAWAKAIQYANSNGGTLFLPPGIFLISETPPAINSKSVNIQGCGKSSILACNVPSGVSLIPLAINYVDRYQQNGFIRDLVLEGNMGAPAGGTGRQNVGIYMIDTGAILVENVQLADFNTGVFLENKTSWSERHSFNHMTFENCHEGFRFQKDSGGAVSFEHNFWSDIKFNMYLGGSTIAAPGDSLFHLVGGAALGNAVILNLNGNFSQPSGTAYIFLLDNNAPTQNSITGFIVGFPEQNGGPSFAFFSGGTSNWVTASGALSINSGGMQGGLWASKAFQFTSLPG
jgi:hypothetical protein